MAQPSIDEWIAANRHSLGPLKSKVCYPEIPERVLPTITPQPLPVINGKAFPRSHRSLDRGGAPKKVVDDFKPLSDAIPRALGKAGAAPAGKQLTRERKHSARSWR